MLRVIGQYDRKRLLSLRHSLAFKQVRVAVFVALVLGAIFASVQLSTPS